MDETTPSVLEELGCTRSGLRPADHSHAETALWAASLEGLRFRRFPSKTVVSEGLLPRGPRGRLSMRMVRWPRTRPRGVHATYSLEDSWAQSFLFHVNFGSKKSRYFCAGKEIATGLFIFVFGVFWRCKKSFFWDLSYSVIPDCTRSGLRPADHPHAETVLWAASLEGPAIPVFSFENGRF